MARSHIIVFSITLLLTLPVGAATWFSRGTYEPDTNCDTTAGCEVGGKQIAGGYMYQNSDTLATGLRIYFNGYLELGPSSVNPNSEILGTRFNPNPEMTMSAYLGVWKDCNEDGYIGAANGAVHTYRSDVEAINAAICPAGTQFNRGGWIYEFIWIGRGGHRAGDGVTIHYPAQDDVRWINDTESLVWADFNRPGSPPGGSCPLASFPQGTFASTGGLIRWVDCITGRRIVATVNGTDSDGSLGLRFEPSDQPQKSDSTLNQKTINLFGDPYAGENRNTYQTGLLEKDSQKDRPADYDPRTDYDPENTDKAFHVWDCSDPQANKVENPTGDDFVTVDDPSGGQIDGQGVDSDSDDGRLQLVQLSRNGVITSVPNPAPGVDNPQGSYYDGVNHTERGMSNARFAGNVGGNGSENCNPDNSTLSQSYSGVETRAVAPASAIKRDANEWFTFSLGGGPPRGNIVFSDSGEQTVRENTTTTATPDGIVWDLGTPLNQTLGQGYQYGLDFRSGSPAGLALRPGWTGFHIWTTNEGTVRGDGSPAPGRYTTFYARIGTATIATGAVTPKGNVPGIYGNEWCNGAKSGVSTYVQGYDCDATHWWNPNFGAPAMPRANGINVGAVVHDPYHLRDVDCVDATVARGSNVQASLASLSTGGPCIDA